MSYINDLHSRLLLFKKKLITYIVLVIPTLEETTAKWPPGGRSLAIIGHY